MFALMLVGWLSMVEARARSRWMSPTMQSPDLTGYARMRTPLYNRGQSFSHAEREQYSIRGLVPAGDPLSLDERIDLVMEDFYEQPTALAKYRWLQSILDTDEHLYYAVLRKHLFRTLRYVDSPIVGEACEKWTSVYRHTPRGVYVSLNDRGRVRSLLDAWPEDQIQVVVVTDGERILDLGDLGVNGMGVPIGKVGLHVACGGIDPAKCLPVHIDVGTGNLSLRRWRYYTGLRRPRERGTVYDELVAEFVQACQDKYGRHVFIQFEGFGKGESRNAFRLLEQHRETACCFNDDIQGTASVVLGGVVSSQPLTNTTHVANHTFLFYGAGEAAVSIANLLVYAIQKETQCSVEEARRHIWMMDSLGLIHEGRNDTLAPHKRPFAQAAPNSTVPTDLYKTIRQLRPTALIGVSAKSGAFDQKVCEAMATVCEHPLIFALSNPTSMTECKAQDAYTWTDGRAVYASGSPFNTCFFRTSHGYQKRSPSRANNAYISTGVGLGAAASRALRITDEDLYIAATALAQHVTPEDLEDGSIYPHITELPNVSLRIAMEMAKERRNGGTEVL